MKKIKKHNLYEVWNEWTSDSAFCEGKPTKQDIYYIVKNMGWDGGWDNYSDEQISDFIKQYIRVFKLSPVYKSKVNKPDHSNNCLCRKCI